MITRLVPSCNPKDWEDLSLGEKLTLQLKASIDPVFFWEHPLLGNLKLWESQKDILKEFYQIDSKTNKRLKSELIFVSGRRGGKTTIAALIGLYEAAKLLMLKDPQKFYHLSPNAEIFCINVAPSEDQALDTVFKRAKELLTNSPFFCSQNPGVTYNTVKFPKNITFKALGSSVASGVGRTVKVFVADEVSSFKDSEKHSPEEIYFKLANSTANFKGWNEDIRVAISSIASAGDFISSLYKQAVTENWHWALPVWKKTWELNPDLPLEVLEEERKRHPEIFDRDYGAEEGVDTKTFFNEIKLDDLKKRSIKVINCFIGEPPTNKADRKLGFTPSIDKSRIDLRLYPDAIEFYITTDPSIKNDAYGLSVGYKSTNDDIRIIGSTVFVAPKDEEINLREVIDIVKPLIEALPVRAHIFDAYMHNEINNLMRENNIETIQHTLNLNDWILLRNDFTQGTTEIPYGDLLFKELEELLLIRGQKVDHPSTGSKDQADSVAQMVSFIRRENEELRKSPSNVPIHHLASWR